MWHLSWVTVCSICHVQPPQQVALTEFKSQVNAPVGPILLTYSLLCLWISLLSRCSLLAYSVCVPVAVDAVILADFCWPKIVDAAVSRTPRLLSGQWQVNDRTISIWWTDRWPWIETHACKFAIVEWTISLQWLIQAPSAAPSAKLSTRLRNLKKIHRESKYQWRPTLKTRFSQRPFLAQVTKGSSAYLHN